MNFAGWRLCAEVPPHGGWFTLVEIACCRARLVPIWGSLTDFSSSLQRKTKVKWEEMIMHASWAFEESQLLETILQAQDWEGWFIDSCVYSFSCSFYRPCRWLYSKVLSSGFTTMLRLKMVLRIRHFLGLSPVISRVFSTWSSEVRNNFSKPFYKSTHYLKRSAGIKWPEERLSRNE